MPSQLLEFHTFIFSDLHSLPHETCENKKKIHKTHCNAVFLFIIGGIIQIVKVKITSKN